jgi:hypothetical protein
MQSIKPFGERSVPKKPWEKELVLSSSVHGTPAPSVDREFPPLKENEDSDDSY